MVLTEYSNKQMANQWCDLNIKAITCCKTTRTQKDKEMLDVNTIKAFKKRQKNKEDK